MEEKLRMSKQEIETLVLSLSEYEMAFEKYKSLSQNGLTLLWLAFLLIPAIIGFFIPSMEKSLLWFLTLGSLICLKLLPVLNKILINIYLKEINKTLGHQVFIYTKYSNNIKRSIQETLHEGSDGNYLQKVVIKTLARTH